MPPSPGMWILFGGVVLVLLTVDLRVRHVGLRSSALWSAVWIGAGLGFSLVILARFGTQPAVTYLTAYVLEKSLSVDNLFVFVLIFRELGIPAESQRRVLSWGVLGALVLRALLIGAGVSLLARFHWMIYPFGVLVLLAAARIIWGQRREEAIVEQACAVCGTWLSRIIPIVPVLMGDKFWVRQSGRLVATPLFIALLVVEATDIVFALDSIPAVLAVTRQPFLVYTSNVFAMLGLRSLYFLLAGSLERLRYVRVGLAVVLAFVGTKMLLEGIVEVPVWASLGVITVTLAIAIVASLARVEAPQ